MAPAPPQCLVHVNGRRCALHRGHAGPCLPVHPKDGKP
jgi:hypothetical protein